ncbi:MAG TPA: HupE/UreJ family protein, partial [Vitreimonas sp.]|nr:HupE/UreJ family protein [Vitreimonas sp.]
MRLLVAALMALASFVSDAQAHTRSQSQSRWTIEGDRIRVRVEADAIDVTRLYAFGSDAPLDEVFAAEVAQAFSVSAGGQNCVANGAPRATTAPAGRVIADWAFICHEGALAQGAVEIESRLFLRVAPSHLHFVALRDADGQGAEAVLTEPHPRAVLMAAAAPAVRPFADTVFEFIPVGAEHVWTGLDHMAFILALVLLTAGRWRDLVLAATGFTIGHTATLGLAAVGAIRPDTGAIEALIGFTIAFVALEIGEGGASRMRSVSGPAAIALSAAGAASLAGALPMSPLIWFGLAAFVYAYPRGFPRGAALLALIFGLIHGCG